MPISFSIANSNASGSCQDLRVDNMIANPPNYVSDKALAVGANATKPAASALPLTVDPRLEHGDPPNGNANFGSLGSLLHHRRFHSKTGWVRQDTHHRPNDRPISDATRGVVETALLLANGSMSSNKNTKGEGDIRSGLVKANILEYMVALRGQLFTKLFANTQIPACVWFLTKTKLKRGRGAAAFQMRTGEALFIDARKLGYIVDRILRAFTDEDTKKIVITFHAWNRGPIATENVSGKALAAGSSAKRKGSDLSDKVGHRDIPGFCKSATLNEIAEHGYVLTPGRYVGAEEVEDDGVPFAEKMEGLTRELATQFNESEKLQAAIRDNMQKRFAKYRIVRKHSGVAA